MGLGSVTISGSYRKYPDEAYSAMQEFQDQDVQVLSPPSLEIISSLGDFVSLRGDSIERLDQFSGDDVHDAMREIELHHLGAIAQSDLLWMVMPEHYIGASAVFEMGWALAHNVPVYALEHQVLGSHEPIVRMFMHTASNITSIAHDFDSSMRVDPLVGRRIMQSTQEVNLNSSVAVGVIPVDYSRRYRQGESRRIYLVDDGRWHGQFTLFGDKIQPHEFLLSGLDRVLHSRTRVHGGDAQHILTFNELPGAGYVGKPHRRVFVDYTCKVSSRVYGKQIVCVPPEEALQLPIEKNARTTVEAYMRLAG